MDDEEEGLFDSEGIKAICEKARHRTAPRAPPGLTSAPLPWPQTCMNLLNGQIFQHAKVAGWSSTIVENVLKELGTFNDATVKSETPMPFKCAAGVHTPPSSHAPKCFDAATAPRRARPSEAPMRG